jgi:hypothetical protein
MNAERLAILIAYRLSRIVPEGFDITSSGGMTWYSCRSHGKSGTHVQANIGVYGYTDEENAIGIGIQALGELQDYVSEATGSPWPGMSRQPVPRGQIRGSSLYLWYDDAGSTVL